MPRKSAAYLVHRVADHGESISSLLAPGLAQYQDSRQRAFVQELAFGTLRWYHQLDVVLAALMKKPLKERDRDIHALLLTGLYQLRVLETAPHAAVSETADAARGMGKKWAVGLVNGVLRNALRRAEELDRLVRQSAASQWSHPDWWVRNLKRDWPQDYQKILRAGMQRPPMTLRVNSIRIKREDYLRLLEAAGIDAIIVESASHAVQLIHPVPVGQLPGFEQGIVSVQDAAAQLCAPSMELQPGLRVLDACAAPGGKTCHLLETERALQHLLAIDRDEQRLERIRENFRRLELQAELCVADASCPDEWWNGRLFDRILLDAPCSASGVVRRHPDIKLLRRAEDLAELALRQQALLCALWPLLAPGGILLYVTCSVFRCENVDNATEFVQQHADAREYQLANDRGEAQTIGRQVLPGEHGMDGFYFARFRKTAV